MALKLINTIENCIEYKGLPYPRFCGYYVDNFCTPATGPKVYPIPGNFVERISWINHFFYDPIRDWFIIYFGVDYCYFPSWGVRVRAWQALDGAAVPCAPVPLWPVLKVIPIFLPCDSDPPDLCKHASIGRWATEDTDCYDKLVGSSFGAAPGSGGQIYIIDNFYNVQKVNALDFREKVLITSPSAWDQPHYFSQVLINEVSGFLIGVEGTKLSIWNYRSSPPELLSQLILPDTIAYLTYEDQQNCWVITKKGMIAKLNYQKQRWEMLSTVQDLTPDAINFYCAFDSRRKNLVILCQRPNDSDGVCQCKLEFYRPLYHATILTDPVPVSPLRVGESVRFVSHLVGDAGEGVGSYLVNAALEAPATGRVLTPMSGAELNGAASFRYRSAEAGGDTLDLSINVAE